MSKFPSPFHSIIIDEATKSGRGSFAVEFGDHFPSRDHLRSNLGIISGPGIICGPVQCYFSVYCVILLDFD